MKKLKKHHEISLKTNRFQILNFLSYRVDYHQRTLTQTVIETLEERKEKCNEKMLLETPWLQVLLNLKTLKNCTEYCEMTDQITV